MNNRRQLWFPFWSAETKEERCQRILSGKLGAKLKRASEMVASEEGAKEVDFYFDCDAASVVAEQSEAQASERVSLRLPAGECQGSHATAPIDLLHFSSDTYSPGGRAPVETSVGARSSAVGHPSRWH